MDSVGCEPPVPSSEAEGEEGTEMYRVHLFIRLTLTITRGGRSNLFDTITTTMVAMRQ
jgi:hypothetical protein